MHDLRRESSHREHGSIVRCRSTESLPASLATIDIPPAEADEIPPSKIYRPLSYHVLALLMPASIFGVLARLGLEALVAYNGQSVFSLAYIQAAGCFVMGIGLGIKAPLGRLYASLLVLGHITH